MKILGVTAWMALAFSAQAMDVPMPTVPLMLDGRCEEAAYASASKVNIGSGATLNLLQDEAYLYLCVDLPEGSLGTIDLYTLDPADAVPVNFHVSGQRGERKQQPDGSWPDYVWENQQGWFGNVVVMKWSREAGYECCIPSAARELQFRKERLLGSGGEARLMLEMWAIMQADGKRTGSARFPEGASVDDPESWAVIRLAE